MREAEAKLGIDVPDSGVVTTYDTNEGGTNLHPHEKTEIGRRLARLAAAQDYGQTVAFHGPMLKSAEVHGDHVTLKFDAGAATIRSADGQPLRDFELAGADSKYVPATAEIHGNTVVVAAAGLPAPATGALRLPARARTPEFHELRGAARLAVSHRRPAGALMPRFILPMRGTRTVGDHRRGP